MAISVNGEYVDDSVIRHEAAALKEQMIAEGVEADMLSIEMRAREWARENVIERVLLRQAAAQDGVDVFLARLTKDVPPPRNRELAEYYRIHRDSFYMPEVVHAAHIAKNVDENNDEAAAQAAIQAVKLELERGRSFEEVADQLSDCPGRGGDLGYFTRGQMVEEFEAVVFSLLPGQTSEVFRSSFGFHIAKVYDQKPEGLRSLNEVRPQIEQVLLRRKKQDLVDGFLADLRSTAEVKKIPAKRPEQSL